VLFVHGCFWHAHRHCKVANRPKSRRSYWDAKFKRNKERDKQNERSLRKNGWGVCTVWECQTKKDDLVGRLSAFLGPAKTKNSKKGSNYG
jgi:DNA mismatch endonuclease (patch repair protein)